MLRRQRYKTQVKVLKKTFLNDATFASDEMEATRRRGENAGIVETVDHWILHALHEHGIDLEWRE